VPLWTLSPGLHRIAVRSPHVKPWVLMTSWVSGWNAPCSTDRKKVAYAHCFRSNVFIHQFAKLQNLGKRDPHSTRKRSEGMVLNASNRYVQSHRKDKFGSMRVTRHAGTLTAAIEMNAINPITPSKVTLSRGLTS
jgi:hypothetical protein